MSVLEDVRRRFLGPQAPAGVVREVVAPDGTYWEIGVLRMIPPEWKASDEGRIWAGRFDFESPFSAVVGGIITPFFKYMWQLEGAIERGRKSKLSWIEARSYYPVHETYYWSTRDRQHVMAAVNDIADGLCAGVRVPRTSHAAYVGTWQS